MGILAPTASSVVFQQCSPTIFADRIMAAVLPYHLRTQDIIGSFASHILSFVWRKYRADARMAEAPSSSLRAVQRTTLARTRIELNCR